MNQVDGTDVVDGFKMAQCALTCFANVSQGINQGQVVENNSVYFLKNATKPEKHNKRENHFKNVKET